MLATSGTEDGDSDTSSEGSSSDRETGSGGALTTGASCGAVAWTGARSMTFFVA